MAANGHTLSKRITNLVSCLYVCGIFIQICGDIVDIDFAGTVFGMVVVKLELKKPWCFETNRNRNN